MVATINKVIVYFFIILVVSLPTVPPVSSSNMFPYDLYLGTYSIVLAIIYAARLFLSYAVNVSEATILDGVFPSVLILIVGVFYRNLFLKLGVIIPKLSEVFGENSVAVLSLISTGFVIIIEFSITALYYMYRYEKKKSEAE